MYYRFLVSTEISMTIEKETLFMIHNKIYCLSKRLCLCFLILMSVAPFSFAEKTYKIAFFSPYATDSFWKLSQCFMRAACNDLGFELKIYDSFANHNKMVKQFQEAIKNDKPDAVLFQNLKKNADTMIKIAELGKVYCFLFNSGLTRKQYEQMGLPRQLFNYWLGEMLPDDERAGYKLANILIDKSKEKNHGIINISGISGIRSHGAAAERENGLIRAIKGRNDVNLYRIVPGRWEKERAKQSVKQLMKKYPDTTVVWTASDNMALGVAEGLKEMGLKAGKNVMTGGFDWGYDALKSIQKGEITASIGGHFMDGGWIMVLLYDNFNGFDFASENIRMTSQMNAITKDNVNAYLKIVETPGWEEKIDFRKFSKRHNPNLKKYDFSLEAVLSQF